MNQPIFTISCPHCNQEINVYASTEKCPLCTGAIPYDVRMQLAAQVVFLAFKDLDNESNV